LTGDFVRLIEPHSEADPAALLVSFLIAAGNYLSRNAYYLADEARHFTNEFNVVVGQTSKSRKGTSWGRIRALLELTDSEYMTNRLTSGLSSGEGLIWAVRNEIVEQQPFKEKGQMIGYEEVIIDPGITDKRLLVEEGEFARVLKSMRRETNTLSAILREAWDHGDLNILTKNQPVKSTHAHISILGHITSDELRKLMTSTETANGFANRFLWVWAKRSKVLPFGGDLHEDALQPIANRLKQALEFARTIGRINFDASAASEWARVYAELSEGGSGLAGAITSRSEAHAVRLSILYALLDLSPAINLYHLRAALAVIDYSVRSVGLIFGGKLGDDTADEILGLLRGAGPMGRTRNELFNHFGRNTPREEISRALDVLQKADLARMGVEKATGGRNTERWYALREKSLIQRKPAVAATVPDQMRLPLQESS
jgi:hypothetical protein